MHWNPLKSQSFPPPFTYNQFYPCIPHLTVTVKGMAVGVDLASLSSLSLATGLGSSFGRLTSRGWHTMRRRDDFLGAWSFHSAIAPPCPDWTHKLQKLQLKCFQRLQRVQIQFHSSGFYTLQLTVVEVGCAPASSRDGMPACISWLCTKSKSFKQTFRSISLGPGGPPVKLIVDLLASHAPPSLQNLRLACSNRQYHQHEKMSSASLA